MKIRIWSLSKRYVADLGMSTHYVVILKHFECRCDTQVNAVKNRYSCFFCGLSPKKNKTNNDKMSS